MQSTPILPLLPSTSFLSTFHSDLDLEKSKFRTTVTDNNVELSFDVDCTRVTIKTQTTSLTLPNGLWRALEAARHHNLHLAEEKVNNSVLSLPTYFQAIERNRKEQGVHPLKDSKGIFFPYSRDINHYDVWRVEDMFFKHADTFSTKSEIFDLPNFQDLSSLYPGKWQWWEPITSSKCSFLELQVLSNISLDSCLCSLLNFPSRDIICHVTWCY